MTPEELLKPRYKVIADYPGCPFHVGQVLEKVKTVSGKWFVRGMFHDPEDFTVNFKKLEWWEERKPEEMPEYVKGYDRIYKMVNWTHNTCGEYFDEVEQAPNRVMFEMKKLLPATADDYDAYLQTLTVK